MRSTEDEAEARVDEAEEHAGCLWWPLAALLAFAVVAYAAWRVVGGG